MMYGPDRARHGRKPEVNTRIFQSKTETGAAAARQAAQTMRDAIAVRGEANIILATGASQFEMLAALVEQPVDWSRVTAFHLDEYIGLPPDHPASFRRYLGGRFVEKVSGLREFHAVGGDAPDPAAECARLAELVTGVTIDVACIGIGENGHLAFNDPPCDLATGRAYIVVELDEACRRQQLGEGWFATLDDVPRRAITMTVPQILKAAVIVCTVPDERKAEAVSNSVEGKVTAAVPGSLLQTHPDCTLYLDEPAASRLRRV